MDITRTVDKHGTIYYKNEKGQFHREDGPAYESLSGDKEWVLNGLCHREDGPARIHPNGNEEWYLNGKKYTKEDWEQEVLKNRLNRIKDL